MRIISINSLITFVLGLLSSRIASGQGTVTFLSNLEQSSVGATAVASNSWVAAAFISGNNTGGYLLNSVQLAMLDSSGSPNSFTVMIYSGADILGAIRPGSSVGTLNGSTGPVVNGVYTYTSSAGLSLAPGADYFIVVSGGTSIASSAFEWSLSGINSYNPSGGWAVFGGASSAVYNSINGSTWNSLSMTFPQFAINATAAPEPCTLGLLAVGGLAFGLMRWNEKKRS